MILSLLLLSASLGHAEACVPTSPATMPPVLCVSCDPSLVTVSSGFTEITSIVNGCLTRTLTCPAEIDYVSGTIAGPATLVLKCNAANTAWTYIVATVTQATCRLCQLCSQGMISIPSGPVGNPGFANDITDVVSGCKQRTLTCEGMRTDTYIKFNTAGMISGTGATTLVATCNADGTAWLYSGTPITQAECKFRCQECEQSWITTSMISPNVLTESSTLVNGCTRRTFTCTGPSMGNRCPSIMYDNILVVDARDGTRDGVANFYSTCMPAGNEWRSYNGNFRFSNVVCRTETIFC